MSQSFTFIDVAGNRAQYTVSQKDHLDNFHWSTEYGDHGVASELCGSSVSGKDGAKRQHGGEPAVRRGQDGEAFLPLEPPQSAAPCGRGSVVSSEPLAQADTAVDVPMEEPEFAAIFHL